MFQEQKALFVYCVSPLHMGAGTALGLIDNPIQRERHTQYPLIAGSGLKGAIRHGIGWEDKEQIKAVFGPDTRESNDQAGAVSFGDAQLVAFPVRSAKRGFVYATSATALGRTARLLALAGHAVDWEVKIADEGTCRMVNPDLLAGDCVALEAFEFKAQCDPALRIISEWLAENALPSGAAYQYFRDKLKEDLILLSDEDFSYFVRNATVVEPHVRIDDVSGTAQDGGLFYTESLPPESLLVAPVMASQERRSGGMNAKQVMSLLLEGDSKAVGINKRQMQVGGDATTGRGQVIFNVAGGVSNG